MPCPLARETAKRGTRSQEVVQLLEMYVVRSTRATIGSPPCRHLAKRVVTAD